MNQYTPYTCVHLCETCYRATNPQPVRNSCCWSGLDVQGNPRLELPEYVTRDEKGRFVTCEKYLSDEDGRKQYGDGIWREGENRNAGDAIALSEKEIEAEIGYRVNKIWL